MTLIPWLLHVANTSPGFIDRREFYDLKDRLLRRYARFCGHDIQEIRKECWGPYDSDAGYRIGCPGANCPHCGGTGAFDLRWVRLERWEWAGYTFHIPVDEDRITPSPYPPTGMISGLIAHKDYGVASGEARLWLYLLCGEWRLFWNDLTTHSYAYRKAWPMLNLQWLAMELSIRLSWRKCYCGRWFPTWGSGRCVCRKCWNKPRDPVPF